MNNLPKGVRLYKGIYVQVRIMRKGRFYLKNFGRDCPLARELASIHAAEKYKEILMGTFGISKEPRSLTFKEARTVFYKLHYENYRNPETGSPRTEESKKGAIGFLSTLGREFDSFLLHNIPVANIKKYVSRRLITDQVTNATINREVGILSTIFTQFKRWADEKLIEPVKLPRDDQGAFLNPCDLIPHMTENKRERVPDTWELAEAYTWCQANDVGLWQSIESALLTALRKGDLVALDGSLTVKGIQQKTGEKFDLPLTLPQPVDVTNWKGRWNALRKVLGWLPTPKGQPKNPKHTTWHDLRHWAPTLLGENGFSIKIIQHYTGHSKEETAERYTNVRRKALEPAVKTVREAIERIKEGLSENANVYSVKRKPGGTNG